MKQQAHGGSDKRSVLDVKAHIQPVEERFDALAHCADGRGVRIAGAERVPLCLLSGGNHLQMVLKVQCLSSGGIAIRLICQQVSAVRQPCVEHDFFLGSQIKHRRPGDHKRLSSGEFPGVTNHERMEFCAIKIRFSGGDIALIAIFRRGFCRAGAHMLGRNDRTGIDDVRCRILKIGAKHPRPDLRESLNSRDQIVQPSAKFLMGMQRGKPVVPVVTDNAVNVLAVQSSFQPAPKVCRDTLLVCKFRETIVAHM